MGINLLELKEEFLDKRKVLEDAKSVLKTEFIGIDRIIDEVIDNVSSWFVLSEMQEKPLVINLWGLTGVGKTSLVTRLSELIEYNDRFFRLDLGEKEGSFSFRRSIEELCDNKDTSPIIIALDEFQHTRTLSGPFREEKEKDHNRMVWELIDSGKIQYIDWKRGLWLFEEYIRTLQHLIAAGVVVEKGLVVSGKELYCQELKVNMDESAELPFISEKRYEEIIEFAGDQLKVHLEQDLRKILLNYSGFESLAFLKKVLKYGKRPMVKNFTKSLIFVLGNLDEAYRMSSNLSADIDADEFYKDSLKITVPKIKTALRQRFRDEQIARLGNIHIIYPALSQQAYLKIIQNELNKIATHFFNLTSLKIAFDGSVIDLIYNEGVYPTQGVRPVFTTINQTIKCKFTMFLSEMLHQGISPDLLRFSVEGKILTCSYVHNQNILLKKHVQIITTLQDLRQSKKNDIQSITAVHESGHAILSAVLLKTIPQVIYSVTSDAHSHGFVYSSFSWEYISKKELIPRVAMMLGGKIAEEIIFGDENVTAGASQDITHATSFLAGMFKRDGMGALPIMYGIPVQTNEDTYHNYVDIEEEIKHTIEQSVMLARETLNKERKLLLAMSDYLSDNRMLKRLEAETLINQHIATPVEFISKGDLLFYRAHLKKAVAQSKIELPAEFHQAISLNKTSSNN